jgi:hypothetical protein
LIERYRRRRLLGTFGGVIPAVAGLILAGYTGEREAEFFFGVQGYVFCMVGGGVFFAGLVLWLLAYRCPVCGRLPMRRFQPQLAFAPDDCKHCGTKLL